MGELLLNTARMLLSKQNFKILQNIEDKELKIAIAKGIARINYLKSLEGWSLDERKEYINKVFKEVIEMLETFNKAIELEYKKIEKLQRLRYGVIVKAFELGAEKLQEIKAKVEARS